MDLRIWVEGTVVAKWQWPSLLPIEFANSGLDLSLGMVPLVLIRFVWVASWSCEALFGAC